MPGLIQLAPTEETEGGDVILNFDATEDCADWLKSVRLLKKNTSQARRELNRMRQNPLYREVA